MWAEIPMLRTFSRFKLMTFHYQIKRERNRPPNHMSERPETPGSNTLRQERYGDRSRTVPWKPRKQRGHQALSPSPPTRLDNQTAGKTNRARLAITDHSGLNS